MCMASTTTAKMKAQTSTVGSDYIPGRECCRLFQHVFLRIILFANTILFSTHTTIARIDSLKILIIGTLLYGLSLVWPPLLIIVT